MAGWAVGMALWAVGYAGWRQALVERRSRLRFRVDPATRGMRLRRFLEREVWSRVPRAQIGRAPTKAEREGILGYGPGGV